MQDCAILNNAHPRTSLFKFTDFSGNDVATDI